MLKGKWCLVTGGGRGIGRSIALALAKESASLALTSRSVEQLESVAVECKAAGAPAVEVYPADLSDSKAVDGLAAALLAKHGCVSVLVNNAGMITNGMTPLEGDPDEWEKMMVADLTSPMRLTRLLSPAMVERKDGAILNISSVLGLEPHWSTAAYCAAKFGLRGWSLSCHDTLRRSNVKVVCINPGFVDTSLPGGMPGTVPEEMIRAEDIAEACLLALKTSSKCVQTDITLRNSQNCAYLLYDPTELMMEKMAASQK
ncbi:unnamed protein product [Ostreobium quekettii]|uniref:Uncharacterized protein n=1 Tax=Ostreobium quekettii TaxID=121088 RepID=A0A8S1J749_9CHLO|nr:unnamed protein product [Ostreobium quekettii]